MKNSWGVDTAEVEDLIKNQLPPLRLKPFLLRMMARGDADRQRANKPCADLWRRHPEMVTPRLWAAMDYDEDKVKHNYEVPYAFGWFEPKILAGTAFDIGRRINDMVVVALDGWRVDNFAQYAVIRALTDEPRMTLTVWDGSRYQDKTVEMSSRRFGVDMGDY